MLSKIIYAIVYLFHCSYRYRYVAENSELLEKTGTKYIFAIWHQNLFAGILAQVGHPHVVIVSKSKDADPVAYVCRTRGNVVTRGSSRSKDGRDKGGKQAKDEMIEHIKGGLPGAVTVDGPLGPAKKVKSGILYMARDAGVPVVPYLAIPQSYWSFNSWDKFRLPKPFSKIIIYYGNPIPVTEEINQQLSLKVEQALLDGEENIKPIFDSWSELSKKNIL